MFRGWGSSIAKAYNAIYNESTAAIEARQKENEEQNVSEKEEYDEDDDEGSDGGEADDEK